MDSHSLSNSSLSLLLRLCRATALSVALRLDINDLEMESGVWVKQGQKRLNVYRLFQKMVKPCFPGFFSVL